MKEKKIIIITSIIAIILVVAISTYALFTWTSPNTTLTLEVGELTDVIFQEGNDINATNIGPVLDYNDGEITEFTIINRSEDEPTLSIYLNITNISDNLKEESFKYILQTSTDGTNYALYKEGNFTTASTGKFYITQDEVLPSNTTYYKFIIYIDGNMENPTTMMNNNLTATLNVEATTIGLASDTIIALSQGDTWESGASGVYETNGHEYRYIGANVNNYVWFNDDMYRIIGVFDEYSHGVEGQQLVKLISANQIWSSSYGNYNSSNTSETYSSYKNDWTGNTTGVKANLNVLLNEYFYNKINTSNTYGNCSNWTYYNSNTNYRTNDCSDIVGYGLPSNLRNYIQADVTWYLYGYSGNGLSKQNFYLCERGDYEGCTSANSGAYATSTIAPIGLMYVSDYMYASGYYSSTDTTTGSSNYYGNQNWLYKGLEWTITPRSNNSTYSFFVVYYGLVNDYDAHNGRGARPTFYLKSDVYVTGGTGSFDDPYTIACDNC